MESFPLLGGCNAGSWPLAEVRAWYHDRMERIFDDDDLDKAVSSADDTGVVSQQQFITEEEAGVESPESEPTENTP